MKRLNIFSLLLASTLLASCNQQEPAGRPVTNEAAYVVLDESLRQLKDDFNAHRGKIRQLFVVGGTCGICLRGMADLNDAFVERMQSDPRMHTMVVHVPTLGAEEQHVLPAIPLLDGPRVSHYWDPAGNTGDRVSEALDIDVYAWDVWLAYGLDAEWQDVIPPAPDFWQHQLGSLDDDLRLDAEEFAARSMAMVQDIPAAALDDPDPAELLTLADGTVITEVMQPRGVAIQQHIMGTGGFRNHIRIRRISGSGTATFQDRSAPFQIEMDRQAGLSYDPEPAWLPAELSEALLNSFEINDMLVSWKAKGHYIRKDGMVKLKDILTWKLHVTQASGQRWVLYVSSHTGDIVLRTLVDENGEKLFSIRASGFREVDGFRLPFEKEYLSAEGNTLAVESYREITIDAPSESDSPTVATH
jgi:predicted small secreted protein